MIVDDSPVQSSSVGQYSIVSRQFVNPTGKANRARNIASMGFVRIPQYRELTQETRLELCMAQHGAGLERKLQTLLFLFSLSFQPP
jgi:hypothetical protein